MKNLNKFQIILLLVFGAFIIVGVFFLASSKGGGGKTITPVAIWGPLSSTAFDRVLSETGLKDSKSFNISYKQVPPSQFDTTFVNALANGKSPDLVFISNKSLLQQKDR